MAPRLRLPFRPLAHRTGVLAEGARVDRAAPLGRQGGGRLIRIGQRRRQTRPVLQLRRHLLVWPQTPARLGRAPPFTRLGIASVIHAQDDVADHGVEGQRPRLALAQGEKRAGRLGLRWQTLLETLACPLSSLGEDQPRPLVDTYFHFFDFTDTVTRLKNS